MIDSPLLFGDFNSSVVRLKVGEYCSFGESCSLFQFQCGAIKSMMAKLITGLFTNFNSSVVRLKAKQRTQFIILFHDFNSSVVRLKEFFIL